MYLIFANKNEADIRNIAEAVKRGCDMVNTNRVWSMIELEDGRVALDVGDGEGLTDAELEMCIDELPQEAPLT